MEIKDWYGDQPPKVSSVAKRYQRDVKYRRLVGQFRKSGFPRLAAHEMAAGNVDSEYSNRKKTAS